MSNSGIWLAVLIVVGAILIALGPKIQIAWFYADWRMDPRERFSAMNEARKTVAQIVGGVAILAGLYFTSRNVALSIDQQVNERYVKGVDQLKDSELVVRLGGIRNLGIIAANSPDYRWIVVDVLAGFVRNKAPWSREVALKASETDYSSCPDLLRTPTDIQAAVEVIGLRFWSLGQKDYVPDLSYSDLRGAYLKGFRLDHFEFSGVHFECADLSDAKLAGADLDECDLEHATMNGADLTGASFDDAVVKDTDLSEVNGLSQEQINEALGNKWTRLPRGLQRPQSWAQIE